MVLFLEVEFASSGTYIFCRHAGLALCFEHLFGQFRGLGNSTWSEMGSLSSLQIRVLEFDPGFRQSTAQTSKPTCVANISDAFM